MNHLSLHVGRALAGVGLAIGVAGAAAGAGPEVTSLLPSGAQRGSTVEVTASGNFPKWPVSGWADRAGVSVTAAADKGKLSVAVAADVAPGVVWLRLYDATGASAPRPFVIGTLGEVVEQEPNNTSEKAQSLATSTVVVNGRLEVRGDVDVFGVGLQKGQTLVASLEAHETLGSPIDAVLQITTVAGTVLGFNHDHRGLDPQAVFEAPADGRYLVRVFGFPATPDSTIGFTGGGADVYRLTLTTGGFVDYPWPLAVTRDRETRVQLFGWNIPAGHDTVLVQSHAERAEITDPLLANVASVSVEPHETLVEVEPNDTAAPQPIEMPVTISGRIEGRRDVDAFSFAGRKGEPLVFDVESRGLGSPLDAVLQVTDAAGQSLAEIDDVGPRRDPQLSFSPAADGSYRLLVRDLNRQGGSRHVYRLRATKAPRDFDVTADAQAYVVTVRKPTEIVLSIARQNGFDETISLRATGLGEMLSAAPVLSAGQGDSAKTVKLAVNAAGGAFAGPIRVVAEAQGASKLAHSATAVVAGQTARTADLWITVVGATGP